MLERWLNWLLGPDFTQVVEIAAVIGVMGIVAVCVKFVLDRL